MSGSSGRFSWTVLVLTCQHKDSVYAFQRGDRRLFPLRLQQLAEGGAKAKPAFCVLVAGKRLLADSALMCQSWSCGRRVAGSPRVRWF